MKKLMMLLLCAFAVTAATAEVLTDVWIGNLKYNLDTEKKTAEIMGWRDSPTEVKVSSVEYGDMTYSVTSVGKNAFYYCPLTLLSLPSAITIGDEAFFGCGNLTSVSLPSATTIGEKAFFILRKLTSVSLPSVTTIGASAFDSCPLSSISLPSATTIGEKAFYCCALTSVSLPSATTIGEYAFSQCPLTSISLPSATTIGGHAFSDCAILESISFPSAITIGEDAFLRCEKLTSVSLPSATTIGEYAFDSCEKLTSISLPSATTIGGYAFCHCYLLTSVSMPFATSIEMYAFGSCIALTSISLPSAITVGEGAFSGCKKLSLVSLQSATSLGVSVFDGTSLSELYINAEMKSTIESVSYGKLRLGITKDMDVFILIFHPAYKEDVVSNAEYEVKKAVVETNVQLVVSADVKVQPSVTLKYGDVVLNRENYEASCVYYGFPPQSAPETPVMPAAPTADDYKVVSADAELVPEGCIAVAKEAIAAAKAETISIVDGVIQLGISVSSNANITAETSNWGKVKFTTDTKIRLSEDGTQLVISIPVTEKEGFMLLQSGEGKVISSDGSKLFFAD